MNGPLIRTPFQLLLLVAAFGFCARTTAGELPAQPAAGEYKITISTEHPVYLLGENVIVSFVLENTGAKEFTASFGADYRGGTRANRFKVTASDSSGRVADDPAEEQRNFGGFVTSAKLAPGQTHRETLSLTAYCRITQPGTYRVRVSHDCGWQVTAGQLPSAETTVTFRLPSEAEAEAVVAKMAANNAQPRSFGDGRTASDFSSLQAPIYLPPLLRRAQTGDRQALIGLGSIATPEATAALIQLASESQGVFATEVGGVLMRRLPDLVLPDHPPKESAQAHLAAMAWDEKLRPAALVLARNWLARDDPEFIAAGAGILRLLGSAEDAPALLATLDRVIKPMTTPRDESADVGNYPKPVQQLLGAFFGLRTRGYAPDEATLTTDGAVMAYFDSFRAKRAPRPQKWQELFAAYNANPCVVLREAAIRSVPYPAPVEYAALLASAKSDPDAGVRGAVLFVTEHKIIIRPPPGFSKNFPPTIINVPSDTGQGK